MRSGSSKAILAALALMPLGACGMFDGRDDSRPRPAVAAPGETPPAQRFAPLAPDGPQPPAIVASRMPTADEGVLLGPAYMVDGKSWTPADATTYDEVGYAALLWETPDGRTTAAGEAYVPGAISAAHRTLPLPSYVEVTALDTGKTILVRVNDRGPLLNDRIIALSPGAARQLGLGAIDGTAAVRVRRVSPPEQERSVLRAGGAVAERIEAPAGLRTALLRRLPPRPAPLAAPVRTMAVAAPVPAPAAPVAEPIVKHVTVQRRGASVPAAMPARAPAPQAQPAPQPKPQPVAAPPAPRRGGFVVQVAALSSRARAEALASALGGYVMPVGALFRVRTGPFPSEAAARGALDRVRAKGYAEARLMANDAR